MYFVVDTPYKFCSEFSFKSKSNIDALKEFLYCLQMAEDGFMSVTPVVKNVGLLYCRNNNNNFNFT